MKKFMSAALTAALTVGTVMPAYAVESASGENGTVYESTEEEATQGEADALDGETIDEAGLDADADTAAENTDTATADADTYDDMSSDSARIDSAEDISGDEAYSSIDLSEVPGYDGDFDFDSYSQKAKTLADRICADMSDSEDGIEIQNSSTYAFYYEQVYMTMYLNYIRDYYGLDMLALSPDLSEAAMLRASECQTLFSHTRPNGTTCFTVLDEYSIPYGSVGENIAMGQASVEDVLTAWWNSPGHQANMMSSSYQMLGVGIAGSASYSWVQIFTGGYTVKNMSLVGIDSTYALGTDLADQDAYVLVTYTNGMQGMIPLLDTMIGDYDSSTEGTKTVTFTCNGYSLKLNIAFKDLVRDFVQRLYTEVLGRNADPSGLAAWTNVLKNGTEQGAKVAQGFIDSTEFKNRNLSNEAYLKVLYRTFFDREPDASGLQAWLKVLDSGLSRLHVFKGFAESDEFTKICTAYGIDRGNANLTAPRDQNEGVTKFVVRCYRLCLGREADESGLNAWCEAILSGKNTAKDVAYGFIFSNEFQKKNLSDKEYVTVLYKVFMDRNPDTSGLNAWIKVLSQGKSRLHVFNGFADSTEFKKICDSYGVKAN